MNDRREIGYLRARALRVLNDDTGNYTMIARQLAIGVLDLMDERDRGARLTDDRFNAEMAELRDEIASVAQRVAAVEARS